MLDILTLVRQLSRPRLLVRAARYGVDDYNRDRDLPRILKCHHTPRSGDAIMQLMQLEAELNDQRLAKDALYAVAAHIDVLTAVMGEARVFQATSRPQLTAVK